MKTFSDAATADIRSSEPVSPSPGSDSPVSGTAPQGIIGILVSLVEEADGFRFDASGAVFEPDNAPLWDAICAFPDVCVSPPGDTHAACAEIDPGPAWPWLEAASPVEPEAPF